MRISDWSSDVCSSDLKSRSDLLRGEIKALDSEAARGFLIPAFKGEILMQFHIEAMTCGGCAGNVVKAIHSVDPKAEVATDPPTRRVQVTSSAKRLSSAERRGGKECVRQCRSGCAPYH